VTILHLLGFGYKFAVGEGKKVFAYGKQNIVMGSDACRFRYIYEND